jgi:hypothetical protein
MTIRPGSNRSCPRRARVRVFTSFNNIPINLVVAAPPTVASQMIATVYDCTTGEPVPDADFVASLIGEPEPGLESPLLPSLMIGGVLAGTGAVLTGGIRLGGQGIALATEAAGEVAPYGATAAGTLLTFLARGTGLHHAYHRAALLDTDPSSRQ